MEDDRVSFCFAAGYPENMDHFLKANPGLASRFDKILRFEDYTEDELFDIALKMFKDEGYTLHPKPKIWFVYIVMKYIKSGTNSSVMRGPYANLQEK